MSQVQRFFRRPSGDTFVQIMCSHFNFAVRSMNDSFAFITFQGPGGDRRTAVPMQEELSPTTLRSLLYQTSIPVADFFGALDG